MQGIVHDLLHAGGIQDRHHPVDQDELGLMGVGRGFGGVVVAHQADHAAMGRGAGHVAVAEDVAGAVDARALAVPEREDAVILALALQLGLLRAPDGGGGEVLVQAGLEDDVGRLELLAGARELLVEPAERRAAIAGDEAGGVQPRRLSRSRWTSSMRAMACVPVRKIVALGEIVFVVERDLAQPAGLRAGCPLRYCCGISAMADLPDRPFPEDGAG